jgi:hypothetical protein
MEYLAMTPSTENQKPIDAGVLWPRFSERIRRLPEPMQTVFFEDLETAIENRLKVLETAK